tara:strand:- start:45 stop:320 length:276 start_codon:yes stop_codon:yes gene_type:complete
MSFTKSNIANNIAKKTSISNQLARQLLDEFIQVVVSSSYKGKVKITGFGTFIRKNTPARIGRNPKTGEEFTISKRTKLNLILSNKIKEKIN